MKAVLVLKEMPSNCAECQFCGFGGRNLEKYVCCLTGEHSEDLHLVGCPLRPLPERKEMPKNYANRDYTQGLVDGWNRCWDEVTGVIWD